MVLTLLRWREIKMFEIEKDWISKDGLRCVVIMTDMKYRCGYVGVNKLHPLYNRPYASTIPTILTKQWNKLKQGTVGKRGVIDLFCLDIDHPRVGILFDVHGGITYSGSNNYPIKSDLWWFGYDCAHLGDAPELTRISGELRSLYSGYGTVRSLEYCINECESLASQLSSITVNTTIIYRLLSYLYLVKFKISEKIRRKIFSTTAWLCYSNSKTAKRVRFILRKEK
jgi:hypothetical protein